MQDVAAFHSILSLAAQHRAASNRHLHEQERQTVTQYGIVQYSAALNSLNQRIADASQNISDEIITAILILACNV